MGLIARFGVSKTRISEAELCTNSHPPFPKWKLSIQQNLKT